MKRSPVMKNAPNINLDATSSDKKYTQNRQPVAPAVAKLSDRVRATAPGNTITQKICGRDVTFKLKVIPAEQVSKATMVWAGNERDQELLTESALNDLIPSFELSGQQFPAYGRDTSGITEIADGSRRRRTAIITKRDYHVLVGELDDEQMNWLSQIGNDYRPTSAFERGKRYARRLHNEFDGNISKLAESESISRKIITRCIATAELPLELMTIFHNPNELSARSGESLSKLYKLNKDSMNVVIKTLNDKKKQGDASNTENVIKYIYEYINKKNKIENRVRNFSSGITATYKKDGAVFSLKNAPEELIKKIEYVLESFVIPQNE